LKTAAKCFVETVRDDELAKMETGYIPANTEKNTQWALETYLMTSLTMKLW